MPSKLAIDGGSRVVPEGMIKSWPVITDADRKALVSVLDSGHLHGTSAPLATELQNRWAEYCGTKYAIVTSSGTGALHMSMMAAGVMPGDEVIVPAFTYWATVVPVVQQSGIPIFADIHPETYTLDPAKIEERITDHTKAILPAHIHGMPADMDPINEIARKHGLFVIEDACQAHGALYKGRKTGSLGDVAGFSCNRSKCLSGGEGGLVTTSHDDFAAVADRCRVVGPIAQTTRDPIYALGWGYRPHEFVNAFILSQLDRLDEYNGIRRQYAAYITEELAKIPGFEGPVTPDWADPCYFCYVVTFRPDQLGLDCTVQEWKEACKKALAAEGMGLGNWQYEPVPGMSVFRDKVGFGKGHPWSSPLARQNVVYDPEEYPAAKEFINSHAYLGGVYPPNEMDLMELYVQGFQKISENAQRVLEAAREQG